MDSWAYSWAQVALRKWLYRRFGSVEAMVEDRIDLWTMSEESLCAQKNHEKSERHGKERPSGRELDRISPELSFQWESVVRREGVSSGVGVSRQATGGSSDWVLGNEAYSVGKALKLTRIEPQKWAGGLDAPGFGAVWREWSSGLRRWVTRMPVIQQTRAGGSKHSEVERLVIERRSMPARRMKELRALQGG